MSATHRQHTPALQLITAAAAFAGALWLSMATRVLGDWPESVAALAGRAMLGMTRRADLSTLLAAYPPLPYLLTSLAYPIAAPLGLDPLSLLSAVLAGSLIAAITAALVRAGYPAAATIALALLIALHPFFLHAVAMGPEALLLLWGVWMFGQGLFGVRATGGINDLMLLALSLPILAFTSVAGAILAVAAVPFLLLAVPAPLLQRAYASVYLVLLFPLLFACLSMIVISSTLLHDPFGFLTAETLAGFGWPRGSAIEIAGWVLAAVMGTLVIAPAAILRLSTRRTSQSAAGGLLGTIGLGAVLASLFDLAPIDALMPVVAAMAVIACRWPVERGRIIRVAALSAIGTLIALTIVAGHADTTDLDGVLRANLNPRGTASTDLRLGRFLEQHRDVMIDGLAHPAVVAGRGRADGLLTASTPAFQVALLSRRITAPHVAVSEHRPGVSDDLIARVFPDLYDRGPPGYRLAYDAGGWRLWSRPSAGAATP